MTLAIKLAIIAALILSIFIPFGIFFMEREQRNVINEVLHLTLFSFFGIIVIAGSDDVYHRSGTGSTSRF